MWEDVKVFMLVLLAICGGITTVLTAAEKVGKFLHPYKELTERVHKCETRLDAHDRHLDNDNRRLAEQSQLTRRIYQVNLALLNHFIDGNGVEAMKKLREDIQNDLVGIE